MALDIDREFGEGALEKFAGYAAEDAAVHLTKRRFLRAAFSAATYAWLTGKAAWSAAEQEKMVAALAEELALRLRARDDLTAAWRGAYLFMLSRKRPWTLGERERMLDAVQVALSGTQAWDTVSFVGKAADFLLLGGRSYWGEVEKARMLAAVKAAMAQSMKERDYVTAADRLALYAVIADEAGQ